MRCNSSSAWKSVRGTPALTLRKRRDSNLKSVANSGKGWPATNSQTHSGHRSLLKRDTSVIGTNWLRDPRDENVEVESCGVGSLVALDGGGVPPGWGASWGSKTGEGLDPWDETRGGDSWEAASLPTLVGGGVPPGWGAPEEVANSLRFRERTSSHWSWSSQTSRWERRRRVSGPSGERAIARGELGPGEGAILCPPTAWSPLSSNGLGDVALPIDRVRRGLMGPGAAEAATSISPAAREASLSEQDSVSIVCSSAVSATDWSARVDSRAFGPEGVAEAAPQALLHWRATWPGWWQRRHFP